MNDDTDRYENDRTRRMTPAERPLSEGDTGQTRATDPANATRGMPPPARMPAQQSVNQMPPPQGQIPPRTLPPEHHGRARARRENGLYLPLWSLALMLISVMGCAGLIVLAVVSLGGNTPTQSPPVIIVSSPLPTERPASFPASPATPTLPTVVDSSSPMPPQNFALSGPTLPPVIISPTPGIIDIGARVMVVDVGDQQLNVRDNPGVTGTNIVLRVPEGAFFTIVGGPQQADGLTWWQIASVDNPSQVGWAASNYLEYSAAP